MLNAGVKADLASTNWFKYQAT